MQSHRTPSPPPQIEPLLQDLQRLRETEALRLPTAGVDILPDFLVKIPRRVSIILLFFVPILLTLIYFLFPTFRDTLTFAVLVFTACAGIVSAIYFARNARNDAISKMAILNTELKKIEIELALKQQDIILSLESERRERTLNLILSWSELSPTYLDPDTLALLKTLDDTPTPQQTRVVEEAFNNNVKVKQNIIGILNFFERLGVAIEKNAEENYIDENLLYEHYRNMIVRYFSRFSPWINQLRNDANAKGEKGDRYYKSFQSLYNRWRQTS